jgi:hypothetical protein
MASPSGRQDGELDSSPQRSFLWAWPLWVLASAVGGAVAGPASEPLGILGTLFLSGLILGAAQVLVLRRYLPAGVAGRWMLASFLGWFAGWMGLGLASKQANVSGLPEIAQQVGSVAATVVGTEEARTTVPLRFWVWAVFAISQSAVLVLGLRLSLSLGALWVLAGAVGGTLGELASSTISARVFPGSGGRLLLDIAVEQAAAGALYGAATGVVLVMIARRWAVQEDNA